MRDTTKPKKSLQHRAQEKTDKYCSDRLQSQNQSTGQTTVKRAFVIYMSVSGTSMWFW